MILLVLGLCGHALVYEVSLVLRHYEEHTNKCNNDFYCITTVKPEAFLVDHQSCAKLGPSLTKKLI